MTLDEVMQELESYGNETTKRTFLRHGAKEPFFGVRVGDLKKIVKRVKKDYQLALDLYATGNSDAMYLAGLIADDMRMTKEDLNLWAENAYWHMISESTVPWVASQGRFGHELAMEWIESDKEMTASAGWSTLSCLASLKPDSELDIETYLSLLDRVQNTIHAEQRNRVRSTMNGFVIAVGCSVVPLHEAAKEIAEAIGKVNVDMGDTSCKVPYAPEYIAKVASMEKLGNKRKTVKC